METQGYGFCSMELIDVISSPLPFSNLQQKAQVSHGMTIQQIVDQVIPERYHGCVDAVVFINSHIIGKENWSLVRPKSGTIVNVRIVPQGGRGKNPLAAILSIAVLIAAPYAAAAYGTTLGLSVTGAGVLTAGQTAFFTGLVRGAVTIVGMMAVNAIAPPPKPSNSGSISNPSESPTLFIEGARNTISPYGVVPVCLGTNRMFPMQAASPYTETQNNNQFIRQLFTYGYGNVITTETRIGETLLSQFNDVDIERFDNGNLNTGGELWSNSVIQQNFNVLLREEDGYTERVVSANSNEAIIDFNFPRGLARFDSKGRRVSRSVRLEAQYREIGSSDWLGGLSYDEISGQSFVVQESTRTGGGAQNTRYDIVVINNTTGIIRYINGSYGPSGRAIVPTGSLKIADVNVVTTVTYPYTKSTNITVIDMRLDSLFGNLFEDSNSFIPTKTANNEITISGGGISNDPLNITNSTSEAFVVSHRIVFPQRGNYEVRVRRVTPDTTDTNIFDLVNLSAIKGVRYESPVRAQDLSGIAVRIRATDQLNGALDQLNEIVSNVILDYDSLADQWVERPTSNPASIYRYVLQGPANANPLPDDKINIEVLQEWHTYCQERGYSCNIVIDYPTSVDETLRLVSSAGSASPAIVDGKRSVIVDRAGKDITQIVTPRNSWGYTGEMMYPKMPHAFRVTFRNADKGYVQDERVVYADGYNQSNATLFEELELRHCTNSTLAWKHARRYLATALLRPETHTFYMDVEHLVSLRGDRIKFEHDVPLIGIGDGRIKEISYDIAGNVTSLVLDDTIGFPSTGTFYIRIRLSDGTQLYRAINASIGYTNNIVFQTPINVSDAPEIGDLAYVTTAGGELDLIIQKIEPMDDLTARITCLNYAPEIFDAETGTIPTFNSNITVPLEFIRPDPPILITAQSDESVMIRNIDGTFTSQAVFNLENINDGDIVVDVKYRATGSSVFSPAKVLDSSPEQVSIAGLDDGLRYDIHIRYKRLGGQQYSLPLQINNYLFIGRSGPPSDVENFRITVSGQTALFTWDSVEDIDLDHYEIRFSSTTSGATWETSQVLETNIYENRISLVALSGTYFIKAVDTSNNYSVNAAVIITQGLENILNAVAILQENPDFLGIKDNVILFNNDIVMEDPENGDGYYYFYNNIDLGDVYTSFISANIIAYGSFFNNIFDMDDIFSVTDIFGSGNNDIFSMDDMFNVSDIFGIDASSWDVEVQARFTNDDPSISPTWSEWAPLLAGNTEFRSAEFRVRMRSFDPSIVPAVRELSVNIDMPDRIERAEDLNVPATGIEINFDPWFLEAPALSILLQNGDAADEIEFIRKDQAGFEFRVFNRVSMDYVERIFDFIASGYGRLEI